MSPSKLSDSVAVKSRRIYDEKLKSRLEAEHFGEVIAVEPESGEYVLGRDLQEVTEARRAKFGTKLVYTFRVGGGGAVRIGGASLNARLSP